MVHIFTLSLTSVRILKLYNKFTACHPKVFNTYINIQWCVSQTQKTFIMFIIILGQHVSILIESSSGPSREIDPYLEKLKCSVGPQTLTFVIPQCILTFLSKDLFSNVSVWDHTTHFNISKLGSIFLEGPEDDSVRIETYCPNTVVNIIKVCCVWPIILYLNNKTVDNSASQKLYLVRCVQMRNCWQIQCITLEGFHCTSLLYFWNRLGG